MAKRGRPPHPDILTPREWDVLTLLREGLTNPEIAGRLGVSRETVKSHVTEILAKLDVSSREEAAAWRREVSRPWWARAFAPLALLGKKGSAVAAAVVLSGVVTGGALLVWGLVRADDGDVPLAFSPATSTVPVPSATPDCPGGDPILCWKGAIGPGESGIARNAVEAVGFARDVFEACPPNCSWAIDSVSFVESTAVAGRAALATLNDSSPGMLERMNMLGADDRLVWIIVARGEFRSVCMGCLEQPSETFNSYWVFVPEGGRVVQGGDLEIDLSQFGEVHDVPLPLPEFPTPVSLDTPPP